MIEGALQAALGGALIGLGFSPVIIVIQWVVGGVEARSNTPRVTGSTYVSHREILTNQPERRA